MTKFEIVSEKEQQKGVMSDPISHACYGAALVAGRSTRLLTAYNRAGGRYAASRERQSIF